MNKEDAHIVVAMANHNMNVTDVAHAIFAHRNTVLYHLEGEATDRVRPSAVL